MHLLIAFPNRIGTRLLNPCIQYFSDVFRALALGAKCLGTFDFWVVVSAMLTFEQVKPIFGSQVKSSECPCWTVKRQQWDWLQILVIIEVICVLWPVANIT